MKLEQQVPSLELCRQLKEAGYPQEGNIFFWKTREFPAGDINPRLVDNQADGTGKYLAASTVAELGEALAKTKGTFASGHLDESDDELGSWEANWNHYDRWGTFYAHTEADARAKLWLWLKEKGYL